MPSRQILTRPLKQGDDVEWPDKRPYLADNTRPVGGKKREKG